MGTQGKFDNTFSTVESIGENKDPPDFWSQLDLEQAHRVEVDDAEQLFLQVEWLSDDEKEVKRRAITIFDKIRNSFGSPSAPSISDVPTEISEKLPVT